MPNNEVTIPPTLRKSIAKLTSELKPVIKDVQTKLHEHLNRLVEKAEEFERSFSDSTITEKEFSKAPSPDDIEKLIESFKEGANAGAEHIEKTFKKFNKSIEEDLEELLK